MANIDSTERFTDTVKSYCAARPGYPIDVLELLIKECGLIKDNVIADIGSGTGLLSRLFLDYGNTVYGVEPNLAMRQAGKDYLKQYSNFYTIAGRAEATLLPDQSMDFVMSGTAFHWFDPVKTKQEFYRIAKSRAWIVILWNVRDTKNSSLVRDYEQLIRCYNTDYCTSAASKWNRLELENFFKPYDMKTACFDNRQPLNWEGLKARLLSASYSLRPGNANYATMLDKLRQIFEQYQQQGIVDFLYKTKLYYTRLEK